MRWEEGGEESFDITDPMKTKVGSHDLKNSKQERLLEHQEKAKT